jgi:hypothetical protein
MTSANSVSLTLEDLLLIKSYDPVEKPGNRRGISLALRKLLLEHRKLIHGNKNLRRKIKNKNEIIKVLQHDIALLSAELANSV